MGTFPLPPRESQKVRYSRPSRSSLGFKEATIYISRLKRLEAKDTQNEIRIRLIFLAVRFDFQADHRLV